MERVLVPKLDLQTQEIEVIVWHRREGDRVDKEEPLLEISTDKATIEIPAPESGFLRGVSCAPGDKVKVGDTLAYICAQGEEPPPLTERASTPELRSGVASAEPKKPGRVSPVRSTPIARKLCQEHSITIEEVYQALGKEPVGEREVRSYLAPKGATSDQSSEYQTFALSSRRRIIAQRMQESTRTIPHIYLFGQAEMTQLQALKVRLSERGPGVTLTDILVWVLGAALTEFPSFNATTDEEAGGLVVRRYRRVNIGLAVSTSQGLVVPVLHDVPSKTLAELAEEKRELISRARANKLSSEDLRGGTFTLSNLGMYGVGSFTAVINPPEVAILAVGAARSRLELRGKKPESVSVADLCLGLDHRVLDGAEGARFLSRVAGLIENPPDDCRET